MKFSQVKQIYALCDDNDKARQIIHLAIRSNIGYDKLLHSIDYYGILDCEIDSISYHEGYMYNVDCLVVGYKGYILDRDNGGYCEYYEDYFESDEIFRVFVGNLKRWYSQEAINGLDFLEYNGEYYDRRALPYNNLVIDVDGNVRDLDDVYYWESDGEYHDEPEPEEEDYLESYASQKHYSKNFTDSPKFFVGIEVEKEDSDVIIEITSSDLRNLTLWVKESDGSLCPETGFEAVSPKYELIPQRIIDEISNNRYLRSIVNADYSKSCGGHLHLSETDKTGMELFEAIKSYMPLIHALYYGRTTNRFCVAKSTESLKKDDEKYQSVRVLDDRIEVRVISAVVNIDTLFWRLRLFDFILHNQNKTIEEVFFLCHTELKPLLSEQYPETSRFEALMQRFINFANRFEEAGLYTTYVQPKI